MERLVAERNSRGKGVEERGQSEDVSRRVQTDTYASNRTRRRIGGVGLGWSPDPVDNRLTAVAKTLHPFHLLTRQNSPDRVDSVTPVRGATPASVPATTFVRSFVRSYVRTGRVSFLNCSRVTEKRSRFGTLRTVGRSFRSVKRNTRVETLPRV